jgi:hypothetical protein
MIDPQDRRSGALSRSFLRRLLLPVLGLMIPAAAVMTVLAKPPESKGASNARLGRVQARIRRPFMVGEGQKPADRKGLAISERRRNRCDADQPAGAEPVRCDLRIIDLQ